MLIALLEHYRKTGTLFEVSPQHAPASLGLDLQFEKIVAPDGHPVTRFRTRLMSTETEDRNHFNLNRETLSGIIERAQGEGRPAGEHAH